MKYIGDFADNATVRIYFNTFDSTGAPVAPSSAFASSDFAIYKNGSATQKTSTNGITVTSPFDSTTGLHLIEIDTSNDTGDSGFWGTGSDFELVFDTAKTVGGISIDGRTVRKWSCENRSTASIKAQTDKLTFDGANNVATITRLMSQAALSQFATDNTGQTSAADGSVANLSQGGSGGVGDATLAKQNEILAAIGTTAVVHAPVITSSLIEVTEGITYDGTFLPKLYWTVTTNYQTADSINLKVWRQEEDGTRTLMKSATAIATSATNIEITSFTANFLAALRYQGTPAFDRLQFCLYATEGSNDYEIASGDFHVKERRTS